MKKFASGAALTALMAVYGGVAVAQETTSSLRGEVTSDAGAPVAGATVVITHTPTGSKSETSTNANGLFSASGLRVGGPYTVAFSAPNYRGETLEGVNLGLGAQNVVTADLESLDSGTDIVVTAARVRVSNTGPATVLNASDIAGVASVNRDIRDLMRRDPLVNLDPTNGNAPQIAGAHYRFNNFSIDGVNFRDEFGLNTSGLPSQRSPISTDALQALTVEITPYSAQNGNFLGGNINAVTKSGTNEFHGSAFYNWQDSFSVPTQVDGRPTGLQKAWDFDTYGFTLGGPILKDKLFFFGSYEWFATPKPGTQGPADDPSSGTPAPGVTTAEVAQITDILKNVYGYDPGTPFRTGAETDRKMLAKIDWNINDNHRFAFTFNEVESAVPFDGSTTGATLAAANAAQRLQLQSYWYNRRESVKTAVGQLNSDWTENLSTELRISQKEYQVAQTSIGGSGIGAFNICSVLVNPNPYDNANNTSCNGEGQILLGTDGPRQANQLSTRTDAYRIKADYRLGDHKIDAGYELSSTKVFNLFQSGAVGDYAFNSITALQNRTASRALFAGGSRDGNGDGNIDVLDTAAIYAYKTNTAFIEDHWDVTDKLQLALGLRYDFLQSDEEPPLNPNLVARSATYFETAFRNIDNTKGLDGLDLLQPRFSFKYDLLDNVQLRGGVGRFGSTGPQVWIANSFQNNGYTSGSLNVTSASPAAQLPLLSNVSIKGQPALATSLMQGSGSASSNVNLLSPDFELPSMWRGSVGASAEFDVLGNNPLRATIDFVYSQNENAAYMKNLRLTQTGTFADGRPVYAQNTSNAALYGNAGALDLIVVQADEGESKVVNFTLAQDYDNGIGWSFGYAHQDVTEISPMTSSTATSNYSNVALLDINNPTATRSLWEIKDRFTLELSWSKEFVEGLETRFSLFGENRSGFPFSYAYSGAVPSGSPRPLLYVPNFAGDANPNDAIVGPVTFTGANPAAALATMAAFRDFVLASELAGYQGKVAPRNEFTSPDISRIDLKFSQDLPWLLNKRGHKLQFNADIINLGNLINDSWGTIEKYPFPSAVAPISATAGAVQPDGTIGYNYSSFVNPSTIVNRCPNANVCPREGFYQIQLGIKYLF